LFLEQIVGIYTCYHTESVKKSTEDPLSVFTFEDLVTNLESYPCSREVKEHFKKLAGDFPGVCAGKITESVFIVYGAPCASNTFFI
jgi:hypothetical protein